MFFKNCYITEEPLIICEGKTDNVYITLAIQSLFENHPLLAKSTSNDKVKLKVKLFKYNKISDRLFFLNGGTADLNSFIGNYSKYCKKYKIVGKLNPVIILIDNDSGSKTIFGSIKNNNKSYTDTIDGSESYYFVCENLYVIAIPKLEGKDTAIEGFFDSSLLKTKLNGKTFTLKNQFDNKTEYGKHLFAEHIVKKNKDKVNFEKFSSILKQIEAVLIDYEKKINIAVKK